MVCMVTQMPAVNMFYFRKDTNCMAKYFCSVEKSPVCIMLKQAFPFRACIPI